MNNAKAMLTRIRRDLVERRMWPVAVLLVAALVAVPLVLRQGSGPADAAVTATSPPSETTAPDTAAAVARVLGGAPVQKTRSGPARDPFPGKAPQPADAAAPSGARISSPDDAAPTHRSSRSASSGRSAPAEKHDAPVAIEPAAPAPEPASKPAPVTVPKPPVIPDRTKPDKPQSWTILSADIRFGADAKAPVLRDVKRLRALPGARRPAALFLGVQRRARGAVFVLSAGTQVRGGGHCVPRAHICTQLVLRPGEHALLTTPAGRPYRIELVAVHTRKTTHRSEAERAFSRASQKGRCLLDEILAYRFDPETGTIARSDDGSECTYAKPAPAPRSAPVEAEGER